MIHVLLLAAVTAHTTPADSPRVAVLPLDQRLELQIDPRAASWSGSLRTRLAFDGTTRTARLELGRSVVSRVEVVDAGGTVRVSWGSTREGECRIESSAPFARGPGWVNVSFVGRWTDGPPGMTRDSLRAVARLARGAGLDFPAWPGSAPTPWTLHVHAPASCDVRASGRRTGIDEAGAWRTWNYRVARPLPADSLGVTVRRRR